MQNSENCQKKVWPILIGILAGAIITAGALFILWQAKEKGREEARDLKSQIEDLTIQNEKLSGEDIEAYCISFGETCSQGSINKYLCTTCGDTMASSFASCHSVKFCENVPMTAQDNITLPELVELEKRSLFLPDEQGNIYGTLTVTGYAVTEDIEEPFCEKNCKKYKSVLFKILNTASNATILDLLDAKVKLGCAENQTITYFNDSDKIGMKEYEVSSELSEKILESSVQNPVTIKLQRLLFTGGSGAPACYSHFTYISE
ncbi:hypothetical protein A2316_01035 [Candidatus Falkowbacteria bacterium RIFOXYB2_FULL_38_15]|uniref:Uncharacterized protein n=1 Tax=Candidatus Falkowbacteria bacterium RIFOXYA2_FULL_38_12 TaxID=1797993 RepID=A0A1F5S4K9_9BACT|nr:MAG: hypothetical protein A2257_02440 [Candidatus Falkowbacteria bacterium RIFOXYA2_FULL_38_12]OGF32774.1 MAG: hypothetical protein A2316_01035 [Candidatus Falkowbacteria bacterium RIFOXYB2_FULL_38_15]OGF42190.1 MAG: hypothetical protein A2555_02860 [Candidatus Falkowbacteria bacterium RIFOXYD2_FULL_39_16]